MKMFYLYSFINNIIHGLFVAPTIDKISKLQKTRFKRCTCANYFLKQIFLLLFIYSNIYYSTCLIKTIYLKTFLY